MNHCSDNEAELNQKEEHQEQVFQGEWIQQWPNKWRIQRVNKPDPDSENVKRYEIDDCFGINEWIKEVGLEW
jgi:ABC-type ATPase with predicted acetyltransferase domain